MTIAVFALPILLIASIFIFLYKKQIQQHNKTISIAMQALSEITSNLETDKIIRKTKNFFHSIKIKKFSFMLFDKDENVMKIRDSIGIKDEIKRTIKLKISEGVAGKAAQLLKPIYIPNISKAPEYKEFFSPKQRPKESLLALPLEFSNELFGVLNIHQDKKINKQERQLYYLIAKQISIALANAKNYELSLSDTMTGLFNHEYFIKRLNEEIETSQKFRLPLSLMLVDIDHFKKINDTYGHQAGDYILIAIAKLLKSSLRLTDIIARYGGEEFAVILPDTDIDSAYAAAERIRRLIETKKFLFNEKIITVTVSVGISELDKRTKSAEELIKKADDALYEAKSTGRNRVVKYLKICYEKNKTILQRM